MPVRYERTIQHTGGGLEFFQPGILVRCEYREWITDLRQYFVFFENHLILEAEQRALLLSERIGNVVIALLGVGLIVVIAENGVDIQFLRQLRDRLARARMLHDQSTAVLLEFRI